MSNRLCHGLLAPLAVLLAVPFTAFAAPVAFIVDDGTSDNAFGNFNMGGVAADVLIANQFDAGPGGATIDEIAYVYGVLGAATPVVALQVVLLEDNDDDGSIDSTSLLVAVADLPAQADNDVFNSVQIPPTFVTGRFFAGVFATGIAHGQALVGSDSNHPPGASFVFAGSMLDLDNVLGTADIFSFDPEGSAIALIRAFGVTGRVPEPATLGPLAAAAAVLLLFRRRRGRRA